MSKIRTDLSVTIFEQLTMPLRDGSYYPEQGGSGQSNANEEASNIDPSIEINVSNVVDFMRRREIDRCDEFYRNYS